MKWHNYGFLLSALCQVAWSLVPVTDTTATQQLRRAKLISETPRVMDRRRAMFLSSNFLLFSFSFFPNQNNALAYSGPTIDVNNAMAREFTAFPGLYPTIATKIVNGAKQEPYKAKKDVYAALDSDLERERLKTYDGAIVIHKPDSSLKQFKASQICKYECGSRVSSAYRDEQIKAVQAGRMGLD